MGYRLSRITTRAGDGGETGLGDGTRVSKDDARIEALGGVDELNSHLGVLLAHTLPEEMRACLIQVQNDLFDLGGELSIPGHRMLDDARIEALDQWLVRYNRELAPLQEFILPGGSAASAQAHVVRSVCRRAERDIVRLQRAGDISPTGLRYLNRLSDLLFVLARTLNRVAGTRDVLWSRNPPGPGGGETGQLK
jgi:cob(I)alamin adenosyltransferase